MERRTRNGFTLIELSIVLVIVGLLISGILVGKTMIINAETQPIISQMESYSTAVRTFRGKYNCVPGDCARASSFNLGTNGDGDGLIGGAAWWTGCYGSSSNGCYHNTTAPDGSGVIYRSSGEHQQFWVQLSAASLISEQLTAIPSGTADRTDAELDLYFPTLANRIGNLIAFSYAGKTYIRTGIMGVANGGNMSSWALATLRGNQLYNIKSKRGETEVILSGYIVSAPVHQRVAPLSVYADGANGNEYFIWNSPAQYDMAGKGRCTSAVAPYPFNTSDAYLCNMIWQVEGM